VEGLEIEVLRSNDWNKYKPKVVLVEQLMNSFEEVEKGEIGHFMKDKGYLSWAKTANTVFYLLP
jgi:desulfoferrodoxin (superoxide reductase-like protein)